MAFSAVLLAIGVAGAASAQLMSASPLDEVNKLARSSSPNLTQGTAPVVKLSVAGRVNEVLSTGGCANNPLTASCGSSCDNITMNGTVSVTGLGKSTLNACYTIEDVTTAAICFTGLGIGTLTNKGGKSINISFGGPFCLNDENSTASTVFYSTTGTYIIEGGAGPFTNETGVGSFNVSDIFTGASSSQVTGIGQISMNGTMSKN